jgi:hypothetical protein
MIAERVGYLSYRLVRNPQKYFRKAWWAPLIRLASYRGRACLLYTVPFLLRSVFRRPGTIIVFPAAMDEYQPAETYLAWKVFAACNLRVRGSACGDAAIAIAWNPSTSYHLDSSQLSSVQSRVRVLNARCTDIRKSTVARHFRAVFGYALEIDPYTYTGTIVRKSEKNGARDETLLQGPLEEIEPGYLYQRFVSYPTPTGMAEWRLFIVGRKPAAVYRLCAPPDNRFKAGRHPEMTTIEESFSAHECAKIAQFCESIGLDFGNVDVLRDPEDGRIYISDCNNTPTGPSWKLPLRDQLRVVKTVAEAFQREYPEVAQIQSRPLSARGAIR